jgi:hypothetical protein
MKAILETYEVSKFDNFSIFKVLQFENIFDISVILLVLNFDKSSDSNFSQPENNSAMLTTFEVSKLDKSKDFNEIQSENNPDIFTTLDVMKFLKFNFSNFEQPENIYAIFVTCLELELELPKLTVVKDLHLENIYFILLTFDISNISKLNDEKPVFSNIDSILVALDVFKLEIDVKEVHPSNIPFIFFTRDVSKRVKSNDIIFVHPENISSIIIFDCLELIKLIEFNDEQPLNIFFIFVTLIRL